MDVSPLSLGYQGNQPAVAGVTMTGPHTGYLSAESARTFGDAVARQFVADHRKSGPKPMASPTFTSGAKLSLAGATTPAPKPMYVMKTLTLKASDIDGAPANSATALVQNLDNGNRFEEIDPFFDGEARESVPVGNYAATIVYFDVNTDGDVTGLRVVTRPQFAVTEDATMSFAATEATSEVTMRTPRPAELQEGGFVLDRGGAAGYGSYTDVAVASHGRTDLGVAHHDTGDHRHHAQLPVPAADIAGRPRGAIHVLTAVFEHRRHPTAGLHGLIRQHCHH